MKFKRGSFTHTIGCNRFNRSKGSIIFAKLLGVLKDEYYDGTVYAVHLWNYYLYWDVKYTPH